MPKYARIFTRGLANRWNGGTLPEDASNTNDSMKLRYEEWKFRAENMSLYRVTKHVGGAQPLALAALLLLVTWLAGCGTTVYKQGDRAADSAQSAALGFQTESQALAGTMATLSDLVDKPAPDLKPQYQSFSAALDGLVAALKRGEVAHNHLVRSNAAFLATWDKQLTTMTNADIRSRSEARRADVSNQFDAAHKRCLEAQDALRSLIGYLQDLRKALSMDLTRGGIDAAKPLVRNANTTADKVQADLAQAGTDLKALSVQMSSGRGQVTQ